MSTDAASAHRRRSATGTGFDGLGVELLADGEPTVDRILRALVPGVSGRGRRTRPTISATAVCPTTCGWLPCRPRCGRRGQLSAVSMVRRARSGRHRSCSTTPTAASRRRTVCPPSRSGSSSTPTATSSDGCRVRSVPTSSTHSSTSPETALRHDRRTDRDRARPARRAVARCTRRWRFDARGADPRVRGRARRAGRDHGVAARGRCGLGIRCDRPLPRRQRSTRRRYRLRRCRNRRVPDRHPRQPVGRRAGAPAGVLRARSCSSRSACTAASTDAETSARSLRCSADRRRRR